MFIYVPYFRICFEYVSHRHSYVWPLLGPGIFALSDQAPIKALVLKPSLQGAAFGGPQFGWWIWMFVSDLMAMPHAKLMLLVDLRQIFF